jgi:hypothetical protein
VAGDEVELYNGSVSSSVSNAVTLTNTNITNGYVDVSTTTLSNATTYDLRAAVTDVAGNVGALSTANTNDVTIDTTASTATISLGADGVVTVTLATATDGWEYSTNATAGTPTWTTGSNTSFTLAGGTYAANTIAVRETDAAGNIQTSLAKIAYAVNVGSSSGETLTGSASVDILFGLGGNDSITGLAGDDKLYGGAGSDTITGGAGADTLSGGDGTDTFVVASGDSKATITGSGSGASLTGYDLISDFTANNGAAAATSFRDILDLPGTLTSANIGSATGVQDGTDANNGQKIAAHTISNGIVSFYSDNAGNNLVTLDSDNKVATALDYLTHNDIGNAGTVVAFKSTISGVTDTYVYSQGNASLSTGVMSAYDLVKLAGVDASGLTTDTTVTTNKWIDIA